VTLTFDQNRGVITVPLPDGSGHKVVKVVTDEIEVEEADLPDRREQRTLQEVRK
jgi:hypothetical protein